MVMTINGSQLWQGLPADGRNAVNRVEVKGPVGSTDPNTSIETVLPPKPQHGVKLRRALSCDSGP